jgi:demethylmenaquinone methyltransferase/2-methoxy-6-polyprenyl-1,4-benzoquinol methylase
VTKDHSFPEIEQPVGSAQSPSRQEVWRMFDRIAPRYDLLNHLLSFRRDVSWRKKLARQLPAASELLVLDLATGTADVLLTLFRENRRIKFGIGLDLAQEMLKRGRNKIDQESSASPLIYLIPADALSIPFRSESFQVITMAFGIRNVLDVPQALREMHRLLKTGGRVLILEFSLPNWRVIRSLYLFYFRNILPRIGGVISGDGTAYRYLNRTVETFPYGEKFCELLTQAGFSEVRQIPLSGGIAAIYQGDKIK